MENKTETKSAARLYGESIIKDVALRYIARATAATLHESGISMDDLISNIVRGGEAKEVKTVEHKMALLDMQRLVYLKLLFTPSCPGHEQLIGACLPKVFSDDRVGAVNDEGEEGEAARKMVRSIAVSSVDLLHDLLFIYVHELSHAAAGEHFGAKGRVAVLAFPELACVGDEGFGVALRIKGGRCMFNMDMTGEQRAVVSVAGFMGEKACTAVGSESPVLRDTEFWLEAFANIHAAGDGDGDEGRGRTYHSGSYKDVATFYALAPTEAERRAAILKAGEIIAEGWVSILAKAAQRAVAHLAALGDALVLVTTAMDVAEQASMGNFMETHVTRHEIE